MIPEHALAAVGDVGPDSVVVVERSSRLVWIKDRPFGGAICTVDLASARNLPPKGFSKWRLKEVSGPNCTFASP